MDVLQNWFGLLPSFLLGGYIGHLADVLSLAWHKEEPVFRKGYFKEFLKEITGESLLWPLIGRKRGFFKTVLEFCSCGAFTALFYSHYGLGFMFYLMMFLVFAFAVGLISDMQWREIPHELNHIIALVALLLVLIGKNSIWTFLLGAVPVVVMFGCGFVMYLIFPSRGFGIGGGDLRFLGSIGLLMGMPFATLLMVLGCLASIIIFLPMAIKNFFGKRTTTFIPMMVGLTSAFILMIFGHYLAIPENDIFPLLDYFSVAGKYLL